jgi:hypothetical protein
MHGQTLGDGYNRGIVNTKVGHQAIVTPLDPARPANLGL